MTVVGDLVRIVRAELLRQVRESGLPEQLQRGVLDGMSHGRRVIFDSHPEPLAALPLAAFESAGGGSPEAAAPAGAAIELLLAAGDVLDDIQDGDAPISGENGDAAQAGLLATLLVLSQRALLSVGSGVTPASRVRAALKTLSDLEIRALAGQQADIDVSGGMGVTPSESLSVTLMKSGSLGRCAAMVGASLATDDASVIERHGEFGEYLAGIYQLMNDISGVWPGGGASTDLSLGRRTPPVSFALAVGAAGPDTKYGRAADTNIGILPRAADDREARLQLLKSGGIHFAWIHASVFKERARRIAEELKEQNPASCLGVFLEK